MQPGIPNLAPRSGEWRMTPELAQSGTLSREDRYRIEEQDASVAERVRQARERGRQAALGASALNNAEIELLTED